MNKSELESKHLADLHALAAEAGVPRYRMLPRDELIAKLSEGGERNGGSRKAEKQSGGERAPRGRRERGGRDRRPREREQNRGGERKPAPKAEEKAPAVEREDASTPAEAPKSKRKRRRRRFGRRSKGLHVRDLLQPPRGRQALIYGESREACTALLREIAGELAEGSIALLVDPGPEELADWKREAPQAELVVAAQARHAADALAQAVRRAESGEDVTLLVDSLSKLEDVDTAKEVFDAGIAQANGTLTVVAALERSS